MQITAPAQTADLIDRLRTARAILTYDPDTHTIRTHGSHPLAVSSAAHR